jgi:hypothetical protein
MYLGGGMGIGWGGGGGGDVVGILHFFPKFCPMYEVFFNVWNLTIHAPMSSSFYEKLSIENAFWKSVFRTYKLKIAYYVYIPLKLWLKREK